MRKQIPHPPRRVRDDKPLNFDYEPHYRISRFLHPHRAGYIQTFYRAVSLIRNTGPRSLAVDSTLRMLNKNAANQCCRGSLA